MAKKYLVDIDLAQNQLQNAVVHTYASVAAANSDIGAGSAKVGQLIFTTDTNDLYYCSAVVPATSNTWSQVAIGGDLSAYVKSLTSNVTTITFGALDGNGNIAITFGNATTTVSGLMSATDKTKLDAATSANTASTLVLRDASGNFSAGTITFGDLNDGATTIGGFETTLTNTDTAIPTSGAVIDYVAGIVTTPLNLKGAIDASTNPNYPAATIGDTYYVSVAGRIGGASGEVVEVGDSIICTTTSVGGTEAAVGGDFIVLQRNDQLATNLAAGNIRIATDAEATTGTAQDIAINPKQLSDAIAAIDLGAATFSTTIGNGVLTSIIVNHNLNSSNVLVQVRETATNALVVTDVSITDANNVTIGFNTAPAAGAYTVVVLG